MKQPFHNPFDWETAPIAHLICDELRDGYYGDYGVSWAMMRDAIGMLFEPYDEAVIHKKFLGAYNHVKRRLKEGGFEVYRDLTTEPMEWYVRVIDES